MREDKVAKLYQEFDERLARIDQSRARLARGYKAVVDKDGLVVLRATRPRTQMPLRGLLYVLMAGVGFKALVLGSIGPEAYAERVADLQQGTALERAAASVLVPDVATRFLVAQAKGLLR